MNHKNIKLISHNDLDGYGSNILLNYLQKSHHINGYNAENLGYNTVNDKVNTFIESKGYLNFDMLIITDISVNEEIAAKLDSLYAENKIDILLLDHHKTSLWLNKYDWVRVSETIVLDGIEEKTSGTELLFEYLNLEIDDPYFFIHCRTIVRCIKLYDTWLWKDVFNDIVPKQLNDLFYILGPYKFMEMLYEESSVPSVLSFVSDNKLLLEIEQNKIDKYIKKKGKELIEKEIKGYKTGIVFAEQYISELGNKLAEDNPHLDLIIMVNFNRISYRTVKEDIDCSEFAKIFGGGGLKKSSGSEITNENRKKIIDILFNC